MQMLMHILMEYEQGSLNEEQAQQLEEGDLMNKYELQ
jgi:hypothetical protein